MPLPSLQCPPESPKPTALSSLILEASPPPASSLLLLLSRSTPPPGFLHPSLSTGVWLACDRLCQRPSCAPVPTADPWGRLPAAVGPGCAHSTKWGGGGRSSWLEGDADEGETVALPVAETPPVSPHLLKWPQALGSALCRVGPFSALAQPCPAHLTPGPLSRRGLARTPTPGKGPDADTAPRSRPRLRPLWARA